MYEIEKYVARKTKIIETIPMSNYLSANNCVDYKTKETIVNTHSLIAAYLSLKKQALRNKVIIKKSEKRYKALNVIRVMRYF